MQSSYYLNRNEHWSPALASYQIPRFLVTGRFGVNCFLVLAFWLGVIHGLGNNCYSKPDLKGFLPRSVKLSATTSIAIEGTFAQWPVEIWIDRPGLEVQLGKKGEMTVKTGKETLPGVYLIAFRDSSGVSDIVPLFVDSLDGFVEKEPNESPEQANQVANQINVSGALSKSGDVDCFVIDCKKGDTLFAGLRSNPLLGTVMDGVIQVCDLRGFVLDQNDDKTGIDPELAVEIPEEGKYVVRVFAFPAQPNSTVRFAGGADYRYLLSISTGPVMRLAFPLTDKADSLQPVSVGARFDVGKAVMRNELNGNRVIFHAPDRSGFLELKKSSREAKSVVEAEKFPETGLQLPFDFSGRISERKQMDWIPFKASKGQKIEFTVESRSLGQELDPTLAVYDKSGKLLLSKDDNAKTDADIAISFTPKADGVHYLRIKDAVGAGGNDYYYRCIAELAKPRFELVVSNSHFEFAKDKPLELDIQVNRIDGFAEPIDVSINGLPEGVICKPVRSDAKDKKTAKAVKLIVTAKKGFQKQCRIIGKSGELTQNAVHLFRGGREVSEVWLTYPEEIKAKK